ncbi:MAG: STAS domain-containing protein [Chitinophagales bacterium]
MKFTYTTQIEANIVTLKLEGDIIATYQFEEILTMLPEWIADGKIYFVIDLSKVRVMTSTGLTLLLTILTKSRNAGGDVVLANISTPLSKLLLVTKLNSIFTTLASVEEAKTHIATLMPKVLKP